MNQGFSILLLQLAQAFLEKNTEEIKSIGTKLSEFDDDNETSGIVDAIIPYTAEVNENEYVGDETVQAFLNNAGISNPESIIYMIKLGRDMNSQTLTIDDFKGRDYYQFFISGDGSGYANDTVKTNLYSHIALKAVGFKDPALIQEVLEHIEATK